MTNKERFEILSKPFVQNKDIAKVLEVSAAMASKIINEIRNERVATGQELDFAPTTRQIPTKRFLEYARIDLKEIHENAVMEKEIVNETEN